MKKITRVVQDCETRRMTVTPTGGVKVCVCARLCYKAFHRDSFLVYFLKRECARTLEMKN